MLDVYIGAEHLVFAVGLFVQVESCFLILFVMGYLTLLMTDVGFYGLKKMLDVLSSIVLRLGNRMVDRWLLDGDTVATPRIVVCAEGDSASYPDLELGLESWLEDGVLLVFIAWLMLSPRSIVRVPWLLTELDTLLI